MKIWKGFDFIWRLSNYFGVKILI